jgi:O-antigen/teichoic acid export membrane protein
MTTEESTAPTDARRAQRGQARLELWGLADQGVASGVNFLTLILLARVLSPTDFGFFVLAFALLQLATLLQTALVTRPHNVLAATRSGDSYTSYTRTLALAQLAFAAAMALLVAAASGAAFVVGIPEPSVFLCAAPALAGWQLQEFGRRVLYTEERLPGAFANSTLTYGGHFCALLVLWRIGELTAESALLALAIATLIGAMVAGIQLRPSLSGEIDRSSIRANWVFGRWLTAADVGYWFSSNFYLYLAAVVLGPAASAVLKAAQTLLGPVSVFLAFYLNYLPIRFARALGDGQEARIGHSSTSAVARATSVTLAYCLLVAVFAGGLLGLVYGDAYADEATTVRLFAVYYVLLSASLVLVAVVTAKRLTKQIFYAHAVGALVSLIVGWPLLEAFGPPGAVVGMIVSWAASTSLLWRTHRLSLPPATVPMPSPEPIAPAKGA